VSRRIPLKIFGTLVALWLVAPTLVVIPLSFTGQRSLAFPPERWSLRWYETFFSDSRWVADLLNSLQIAALVGVLATVAGTAASYALTRGRFRGRGAVGALLIAPMLVPTVVFAVGVYALFLELRLVGTFTGFLIAHTVLALPFVIIPVSSVLSRFDTTLERAAAICGASRGRAFVSVTLPVIAPGLLSGFMFAFVTSFDEVVVSMFISSPYLETLPVRMYSSIQRDVDPTIAAAATLIICFTSALIAIALLAQSRRRRVS
jgi:putative spermidine/putrescine transport system permease protein